MSSIALHAGDNRISLRRLIKQGVRVHSVVCDPPYNLTSITKRFGKQGTAAARTENNDGSFARLSGGFMGKAWDATGIERDPEFWKLVYEILLPGGYVFAFSGARTGHWQACAMEIAGFILHPMHGWVYGSGFPKGHDPDLAGFEGYAYGTQTQKPALEPIYLGQRPFSEKTGKANILKHGVGAFNIDGCRVPCEGGSPSTKMRDDARKNGRAPGRPGEYTHTIEDRTSPERYMEARVGEALGRYPSNLILDGSQSVIDLFPFGKSGKWDGNRNTAKTQNVYGEYESRNEPPRSGDEGSNARFFHQFPLTEEDYRWAIEAGEISEDRGDAIIYNQKAGKLDRAGSEHPTVKPLTLLQYLIRHITPPGGIVLDPFAGSGTTAEAARREGFDCILMEAENEYVQFVRNRFKIGANQFIGINSSSPFDLDNILGDEAFEPARSVSGTDLTDLLS